LPKWLQCDGFIINHKAPIAKTWNALIFTITIITSYLYAVFAANRNEVPVGVNAFEALFLMDLVLNFMKTFRDKITKQIISNHDTIISNYMDNGFWGDFVPLIPL